MKKIEIGLNKHLSNADYHADREYFSSSALKLLRKDKMDFLKKYILNQKDEEFNPAFAFGTYVHTAMLEPELLDVETAVYDGTARVGSKWKEFEKANEGKTVITRPDKLKIDKIMNSYSYHNAALDMLSGGVAEETYAGEINGIKLKVRADYIKGSSLIDVKTTSSPLNYSNLQSTIHQYDYDLSAALYMDVINLFRKDKLTNMFFVFASKKHYDIMVVRLSDEFLEAGRRKYLEAVERYKMLDREGFFTIKNLGDLILEIQLPEWLK
jgi:hypothetical protein